MYAYFNRFTLQMTKAQALAASQPGKDASADVLALFSDPKIRRQLAKISPADIAAELREYGAWEESELKSQQANENRILWISACNIREELAQKGQC